MGRYWQIARDSTVGYGRYLVQDVSSPSIHSYFYVLLVLSIVVYALERVWPWREKQPAIRGDFWVDAFYMFFNFFLFSLLGFAALSDVAVAAFADARAAIGLPDLVVFHVESLPVPAQLLVLFLLRDFIQYWIHRLLHWVPFLWRLHRVHHSVTEMGFAAHLRYHPLENVVYRTLEYIPLAMVGYGIDDFMIVHVATLTIGHLNHANFPIPYGPLRYILNSPQMHIWHHAKELPNRFGVNFGITLSVWDFLFRTAYWPGDGRDIPLGFEGIERYPHSFFAHLIEPFQPEDRPDAGRTISR